MKVSFIYAEKDDGDEGRELILANAFLDGVMLEGDEAEWVKKGDVRGGNVSGEAVCMVGVKSLKLFRQMRAEGRHVIYFDKGYFRHRGPHRTWEYWRVAVDDHHPTEYITTAKHTPERWLTVAKRRACIMKPWRSTGTQVVYAGSSEKYHAFCGLKEPTKYAEKVIQQIRRNTRRPIVYRPKPTWFEAVPLTGSSFSPRAESIHDVLEGAWCLVTNGSNASFDAVIAGIPCIVLGNAIAKPISSSDLADLENPRLASNEERLAWLSNMAWCQFTEAEMAAGMAWQVIKPQLFGEVVDENDIKMVAGPGMRPSKALLKKTGQWKKEKAKRTKAEQRALKPFTKGRKGEN